MSTKKSVIGSFSMGRAGFNSAGKLIDTWSFSFPFSEALRSNYRGDDRKPFEGEIGSWDINVYMLKEESRVFFEARCERLQKKWAGDNLDTIRVRVIQDVSDQAAILEGATWEPWLEVKTRRSGLALGQNALSARTLEVTYSAIMKGRHPAFPGQEFQLGQHGQAYEFPRPKQMGVNESSGDSLKNYRHPREVDAEYAYVPDTPENRLALDEILAAMDKLSQQLANALSSHSATDTLSRIHQKTAPALPRP